MARVSPRPGVELSAMFGEIDIYLFDQLLRGRFDQRLRVLDAGCGDGRNLMCLLRRGFACFGIDRDPAAIERVRACPRARGNVLRAPRVEHRTGRSCMTTWCIRKA